MITQIRSIAFHQDNRFIYGLPDSSLYVKWFSMTLRTTLYCYSGGGDMIVIFISLPLGVVGMRTTKGILDQHQDMSVASGPGMHQSNLN